MHDPKLKFLTVKNPLSEEGGFDITP